MRADSSTDQILTSRQPRRDVRPLELIEVRYDPRIAGAGLRVCRLFER